MRLFIIGLAALCASTSYARTSGINPTSVKITIYGAAVSLNSDCSNAVVLNYNPAGTEYDFMQNPSILSGSLTAGSYPCVVLLMKDIIKFTPAETSTNGYCQAGTETTVDVCQGGSGQTYTATTFNSDGTVTYGAATNCAGTPTAQTAQTVAVFLSTASTNNCQGGNSCAAFSRPSVVTNGITLANPFVVTGSNSGTFVVNFLGQIDEQTQSGQNYCNSEAPLFSFR